ncbi:hypothetical protein HNP46_003988 [Pseudomonas nitritireducens]|uniref:DUF155 domain-containing protein n=1 Tax=Pseudomonas nitroreducens TaxID=46680 RepID=A0A7W7KLR0_PSENT|nr:hypothetical protein [Pseudomonas nitritireducens]MBB4865112.1 hypothetical protein [Pseudomonas nitritireducens]
MTTALVTRPVLKACIAPCLSYRVRFVPTAETSAFPILARLRDPQPALAVLARYQELAEGSALPAAFEDNELCVIFARGGLHTSLGWRQGLEAWMGEELHDSSPVLEAPSFGERVLWRPGRAVVIGNAERYDELLDGLIAFAWYEYRLRLLEQAVAAAWLPAADHIRLTHQVARRDLARQGQINGCVQSTTSWRMAFVRVEAHLETPPRHLAGPIQRLYNELAVQANTHDRLAALDERIEVLQDLYELATDRLSEYRYFRRELQVEWLIVAILLIEAGMSLWELWKR